VLAHALARQPEERYGRVLDFLSALEALQTAAVAERIAAEVTRLSDQMREALKAGQFEAAVADGQRLLELQPDHGEGARLLGEAQAKLAKRNQLVEQLDQERASLAEEQRRLEAEKVSLNGRQADLEAEEKRLSAERIEAERRLVALQETLAQCEKDKDDLRTQSQALEPLVKKLNQREERLGQVALHLKQGDLEQVERLLTEPPEPKVEPQPEPARSTTLPPRAEALQQNVGECPVCGAVSWASRPYCVACGARLTAGSEVSYAAKPELWGKKMSRIFTTVSLLGLALAFVAFFTSAEGWGVVLLFVALIGLGAAFVASGTFREQS
jgi:DNA repair exonuclease SbcCD ATPase subunit